MRDGETRITSLQFARSFPEAKELLGWMRNSKFFNPENQAGFYRLEGSDQLRVMLYGSEHYYSIVVSPTYLGCVGSERGGGDDRDAYPHGGRDMTDGKFNQKTWMSIVMDILAWEMRELAS